MRLIETKVKRTFGTLSWRESADAENECPVMFIRDGRNWNLRCGCEKRMRGKAEIRNPKSERNQNTEIRRENLTGTSWHRHEDRLAAERGAGLPAHSSLEPADALRVGRTALRRPCQVRANPTALTGLALAPRPTLCNLDHSSFGIDSDFGFRPSDFPYRPFHSKPRRSGSSHA